MGFSARLFRRTGVQNGEFETPMILKALHLTGSIIVPIGPQKFETCPDWGAVVFFANTTGLTSAFVDLEKSRFKIVSLPRGERQ
jgi:hypothetical protein